MRAENFLVIWILFTLGPEVYTAETPCTNGDKFGKDNPNSDAALANTNTYYKSCAGTYSFTCCGVIDRWEYEAEATGNVELLVWRPTGVGSNYRLVSSFTHNAAATGDQTVSPGRYLVKTGDCVGWYTSGADIVGYKNGGTKVSAQYLAAASVNTAGDVDWSGATSPPDYEWGIGGRLDEPADPTFSGPSTGSIGDQAGVGDAVVTVTFTDSDLSDELTLTMTSNTYFTLTDNGDGTGDITVKASTNPVSATTQTISITATDLCGLTVTETVAIEIINDPPVLANHPVTADVSEDVPTEVTVGTYDCSDTSGTVTSSITESPANTPPFFFVKATGTANEYAIVARSQADTSQGQFDYNTQRTYELTLDCCDNVVCVDATTIVNLVQNTPPYITNLPAGTSVDVTQSADVGTVIFTVEFTDDDGDTVDVWGLCDPAKPIAVCPFKILDSGDVIVNSEIDPSISGLDLIIGVADDRNNGTSKRLSVVITGRNNPPVFTNLNNTVIVADNTAANEFVFPISATDDDGDTLTYTWIDRRGGSAYFGIDPTTGEVTTLQLIDYDTISLLYSTFLFVVTVTDGEDSATATLTLTIEDANDPFWFSSSAYRTDIVEWTAVGTTLTDINLIFIDDDLSDTYTCTMDCGNYSGYFSMLADCNVTVAALYKLDDGLPTEITCSVNAEDRGGHTNSTTVIIAVDYDNNYTPTFETTNYDFSVSSTANAETFIGLVNATDGDLVSYGTFSYTLTQRTGNYFQIDSATGEIKTRTSMTPCDCEDKVFVVTVLATDTGGLVGTSTVQITVIPPTLNTDDRFKTFFEDERNIAWFVILVLISAITVVVSSFVCFKYMCMQPCQNPFGRYRNYNIWRRQDNDVRAPRHVPNRDPGLHSVRKPPPATHSWKTDTRMY